MRIEGVLNSQFKDPKRYADKARSLIFNLRDKKNPELRSKVLKEEFTALQLVTLSPKELASDKQKQEREEVIKASLQEKRTDWQKEMLQKNGSNQGFFTCGKCGSKKTTYY